MNDLSLADFSPPITLLTTTWTPVTHRHTSVTLNNESGVFCDETFSTISVSFLPKTSFWRALSKNWFEPALHVLAEIQHVLLICCSSEFADDNILLFLLEMPHLPYRISACSINKSLTLWGKNDILAPSNYIQTVQGNLCS